MAITRAGNPDLVEQQVGVLYTESTATKGQTLASLPEMLSESAGAKRMAPVYSAPRLALFRSDAAPKPSLQRASPQPRIVAFLSPNGWKAGNAFTGISGGRNDRPYFHFGIFSQFRRGR